MIRVAPHRTPVQHRPWRWLPNIAIPSLRPFDVLAAGHSQATWEELPSDSPERVELDIAWNRGGRLARVFVCLRADGMAGAWRQVRR